MRRSPASPPRSSDAVEPASKFFASKLREIFVGEVYSSAVRSAVVLLSIVAASSVFAAPTNTAKNDARRFFHEGRGLAEEHRWAEALEAFSASYDALASPLTLFNIGYCQRALGRTLDARTTFRKFLADAPGSRAANTVLPEVKRILTELEARVARITVTVDHVQTRISIDGRPVEAVDGKVSLEVDPGFRSVLAERQGYKPFFGDLTISPGQHAKLTTKLDPLPATLLVQSSVAGAKVSLDGKAIGPAPASSEVAPGKHVIAVAAAGYIRYETTIEVNAGDEPVISAVLIEAPPPPAPPPLPPWVFWATGGAAASSGLVAGFFAVRLRDSESSFSAIAGGPPPLPGAELARLERDGQTHARMTNIFVITAGSLAVVAAVAYFFTDWDDNEARADDAL